MVYSSNFVLCDNTVQLQLKGTFIVKKLKKCLFLNFLNIFFDKIENIESLDNSYGLLFIQFVCHLNHL